MFLEYLDNFLPVHSIEVITDATSRAGRPGAPWEGALTLDNVPGKANLVDLGVVFVLDYPKPVPVDY